MILTLVFMGTHNGIFTNSFFILLIIYLKYQKNLYKHSNSIKSLWLCYTYGEFERVFNFIDTFKSLYECLPAEGGPKFTAGICALKGAFHQTDLPCFLQRQAVPSSVAPNSLGDSTGTTHKTFQSSPVCSHKHALVPFRNTALLHVVPWLQ